MRRSFIKTLILVAVPLILGVILLHAPYYAKAQDSNGGSPIGAANGGSAVGGANGGTQIFPNPAQGGGTICGFLVMLLNLITEIGAIIGVLAIIACGFMFIFAQGNKDRLDKVKKAFLWTVLGVVLLLGASVIGHILITTVNSVLTAGGNNLPNQSDLTCTS